MPFQNVNSIFLEISLAPLNIRLGSANLIKCIAHTLYSVVCRFTSDEITESAERENVFQVLLGLDDLAGAFPDFFFSEELVDILPEACSVGCSDFCMF